MKDIPIIHIDDANFDQELRFAIWSTNSASDYSNDRERPYNGQPHTQDGIRGQQTVRGLTMRDIRDCYIVATLESCHDDEMTQKVEDGTWRVQDVYEAWKRDPDMDPIAIVQNMTVNIEKMMGIYPNQKGCPTHEEVIEDIFGATPSTKGEGGKT